MLLGMVPFLVDMIDVATDTNAVDLPIGGKDADRDRNVVAAARAIGDVLEQERLALRFRDAAPELPAHERVHFVTSRQLSQMSIVRLLRVIDSATDRTMPGATEFVFANPKAMEAGADDWLDVHDQIV